MLNAKQLAAGICNQSEISRLEKGEVFPKRESTIFKLSLLSIRSYGIFPLQSCFIKSWATKLFLMSLWKMGFRIF